MQVEAGVNSLRRVPPPRQGKGRDSSTAINLPTSHTTTTSSLHPTSLHFILSLTIIVFFSHTSPSLSLSHTHVDKSQAAAATAQPSLITSLRLAPARARSQLPSPVTSPPLPSAITTNNDNDVDNARYIAITYSPGISPCDCVPDPPHTLAYAPTPHRPIIFVA